MKHTVRRDTPPARPSGIKRLLFRMPRWLYRAHLGWIFGRRLVLIHHIGRKSGRRHEVVVEVASHDPTTDSVVVVSGFGSRADWYQNLLAHPDTTIQLGRRSLLVHATPLDDEDAAAAMASYARRHPRAARALAGFMGFQVDGSGEDYRDVGRRLPMLRLKHDTAQ
jgi:deazaflavin-dependent oxidoreductase (nitroreductase family)